MKILVLNAGSSSQKSCLYDVGEALPELPAEPLWEAKIDWSAGVVEVKTAAGESLEQQISGDERSSAIAQMLNTLWQ